MGNPHRIVFLDWRTLIFGFEVVYNLLIAVHEREEHKKYECYLCSKLFSQETTLESHISTVHASNIDQKCENCEKSFSSPTIFKRHIMLALMRSLKPHFYPFLPMFPLGNLGEIDFQFSADIAMKLD